MPGTEIKSVDELAAFVIRHPIRFDALQILNEQVASPREIAALTGYDLNKVSNHVRALHGAHCIEFVRTESRGNNAVEHFYRASLRPNVSDEAWAKLSEKERHEISGLVFQAIAAEGLAALRARTFDSRINRHLSWQPMDLDEDGWEELVAELRELLERLEAIQARAYHRMVNSKEEGMSVIAAAMGFPRARRGRAPRPPL